MISDHDLIALVPLFLLGALHRYLSQRGSLFLIISNLPSTILHELAHFIVALLLGGTPTGFSIWPQRQNGRWRLGSVTAHLTICSAAPTALAPLLWLLPGYLIVTQGTEAFGASLRSQVQIYLAAYICLAAAVPSRQDIKVLLSNPLSILCWSALLWLAYTIANIG